MNRYFTPPILNYCRNVVFSDNVMETGTDGKYAFQALSLMDGFNFENNSIINNSTKQEAVYISYETYEYDTNEYAGTGTRSMLILGNNLQNGGMYLENCMQLQIHGNKIRHNGKLFSTGINIRITEKPSFFNMPPAAPVNVYTSYGNLSITDNEITNAGRAGIIIKSSNQAWKFNLLHIDHNTIAGEQMAQGIQLEAPNGSNPSEYWDKAMIGTGNILSSGVPNAPLVNVFGSWLKAANPLEEQWIANGNPNSLVTAPQGATAIDKTIVADNTYMKNTLSGSEGWRLVSERNKQVLILDLLNGQNTSSGVTSLGGWDPLLAPNNINAFGSTWQLGAGNVSMVYVNQIHEARASGSTGGTKLAVIDAGANGELKGEFRIDLAGLMAAPVDVGLCFRYSVPGSHWRFSLRVNSNESFEVRLETIGASSPIFEVRSVALNPNLPFTLRILMKNDFISAFFNDLNVVNVISTHNNTFDRVGLFFDVGSVSQNLVGFCRKMKFLSY